jgi:hypothetical protein
MDFGGKVQRRETDHYPHLVPGLKMRGTIPPLPHYVFMAWYLVKHRDFTLLHYTGKRSIAEQELVDIHLSPDRGLNP